MEALPDWVAQYVGIPFKDHGADRTGCDCWGLLTLVEREQFGLVLPTYAEDYATTTDLEELTRVMEGRLPTSPWREIPRAAGRAGDGLLFRIEGAPIHVGVLVTATRFLHTDRQIASVVDRLDSIRWARRLLGVFRYGG